MADKTVEQKLRQCKTVMIQNIEKGVQNAMLFRYMKEEKIDTEVKGHTLNPKDGLITLTFADHEKAKAYYDKANFRDKILLRPFNIYFNVTLNDSEMKKYYFDGANEENIRKMFEICRKVAICKIYTSYTTALANGKLKPTGLISFIRKNAIEEQELAKLKEELSTIGVKINDYIPDKGLKCALMVTDFYKGDLNDDLEAIEKNAKEEVTALMNSAVSDSKLITGITPIVKRREIPNPDNKEGVKIVTKVKALVELGDYESAIKVFEEIRIAFIKLVPRAILHFYNAETNSYISLFTSGLEKPQGQTEREFENSLIESFRKINKNVVQVNVFPNSKFYVARVYLKTEEDGRHFIVDYIHHKQILAKHYKKEGEKETRTIRFNINVDDKTMRKIKQFEKNVGRITGNIKNEADRIKQNKGHHQIPLGQGFNPMIPPNMMQHPPGKIPMMPANQPGYPMMNNQMPPQMGMVPQMGMIPPPMGGPSSMPMPPMGIPAGGMGFGMPMNQMGPMAQRNLVADMRTKIDKLYERKNYFIETCLNDPLHLENVKKQWTPQLKFVLETDLGKPILEADALAKKILQKSDIGTIIEFLKKPHEFSNKVLQE